MENEIVWLSNWLKITIVVGTATHLGVFLLSLYPNKKIEKICKVIGITIAVVVFTLTIGAWARIKIHYFFHKDMFLFINYFWDWMLSFVSTLISLGLGSWWGYLITSE